MNYCQEQIDEIKAATNDCGGPNCDCGCKKPLQGHCPRCDAPTEPTNGVCYVCELDLDDFFEREAPDDDFCTICAQPRTICEERL